MNDLTALEPTTAAGPSLTNELAASWEQRAVRAAIELGHAEHAPGLFKPEHVEQLVADFGHANRQAIVWGAQA